MIYGGASTIHPPQHPPAVVILELNNWSVSLWYDSMLYFSAQPFVVNNSIRYRERRAFPILPFLFYLFMDIF